MGIFSKKKPVEEVHVDAQLPSQVEIEVAKNATDSALKTAKEANQKLNQLLVENGFTIKIYVAAGGKQKRKAQ